MACSPEWSAWVSGGTTSPCLLHHRHLHHRGSAPSLQSCSGRQGFVAYVYQQLDAVGVAAEVGDGDDNYLPSVAHLD